MAILIIGCGFIGRNLLSMFLTEGLSVKVLDRNPCPPEFLGKVPWYSIELADILSHEYILNDVDCVYHLASSSVPGDLSPNFVSELNDNVLSSLALLDLCLKSGVSRFVFASSSSVYGDTSSYPVLESHPCLPISSHGLCKLFFEKLLILKTRHTTLSPRILRISNPYGPGQDINGRQGFIAISLGSLIHSRRLVLRNPDHTLRDFIYIEDLLNALYLAGSVSTCPPILNISSGIGVSLSSVVALIERLTNQHLLTLPCPPRDQDILVSVLDPTLAKESLGFQATYSLEDGLRKLLHHHNFPSFTSTLSSYLNS